MGRTQLVWKNLQVQCLGHHGLGSVSNLSAKERYGGLHCALELHAGSAGIGHQLMVENGFVHPGSLVVASDSHSNMYGALAALGTPVVRTDAAIGCLIVDWGRKGLQGKAAQLISLTRKRGLDVPVIVLVRPQLGENIGMAARAMLNCGLARLRLVAPRDGWPNDKAQRAASGADVVLENAEVFDSVADAVADLEHVVATTARNRELSQRILTARSAAAEPRMSSSLARSSRSLDSSCSILIASRRAS